MNEVITWYFVIHCISNCGWFATDQTNDKMGESTKERCIESATFIVRYRGLKGEWEIDCQPTKTLVKIR